MGDLSVRGFIIDIRKSREERDTIPGFLACVPIIEGPETRELLFSVEYP
jgi:hypothetical protein